MNLHPEGTTARFLQDNPMAGIDLLEALKTALAYLPSPTHPARLQDQAALDLVEVRRTLHPTMANVLNSFMPTLAKPAASIKATKAANLPNEQTVVPPGFYEYQYTTTEGLVLDCHLDYEKPEAASHSCPGTPECITLTYALVNGVDIASELSEGLATTIEEDALCSMEMDQWNSDYDRAADRHEERMAA